MTDIIGYFLMIVGTLFDVFGCVGLVRFPDVYNRLQASTKCVTLGTIFLLIGAGIVSGHGATTTKAIICAVFIMLTSPTAAHAIAKGSHASGVELSDKTIVDKYAEDKK
jgi:multicomponent Na+:H+ antiporter subunit G